MLESLNGPRGFPKMFRSRVLYQALIGMPDRPARGSSQPSLDQIQQRPLRATQPRLLRTRTGSPTHRSDPSFPTPSPRGPLVESRGLVKKSLNAPIDPANGTISLETDIDQYFLPFELIFRILRAR
jgi:hypothetical protein